MLTCDIERQLLPKFLLDELNECCDIREKDNLPEKKPKKKNTFSEKNILFMPDTYLLKEYVEKSPDQFLRLLSTPKGSAVFQKKLKEVKQGIQIFCWKLCIIS